MDRAEAIQKIEAIIDNGQDYGYWTDAQRKALNLAIEALEADMLIGDYVEAATTTDCISRAEQVTSKLNNPDDSLVTEDSEACKEQKSKLDCISREQAIEAVKNICNTPCNEYFVKAIESIPPTDTVSRDEMAEVTDMNTRLKNEIEYLQMLLATKSEHLLDDETIICSPKIADKVMEALQEKPSGDMVSIADAIAAVDKVVGFSKIERQRVKEELNALPPVTPTNKVQQADTLIIAAALWYFAQDSERNIPDRERAEELREQVLAYGASMCKPVTPTEQNEEDILKFYYVESLDEYWIGQRCGTRYYGKWTGNCFTYGYSRYLPWGEHVVAPDTLWKEHTYPSEPKEIPFNEWLQGFLEKECQTERTGEWEHDGSDWENRWVCSECGYKLFEEQTTYCGNCGAKMKGGTENE